MVENDHFTMKCETCGRSLDNKIIIDNKYTLYWEEEIYYHTDNVLMFSLDEEYIADLPRSILDDKPITIEKINKLLILL
jgi:hypothetical protein